MSALSSLITRVTKREFSVSRDADEMARVLDRTIAFAEGEAPYISDEELDEVRGVIPDTPTPQGFADLSETVDEHEDAIMELAEIVGEG